MSGHEHDRAHQHDHDHDHEHDLGHEHRGVWARLRHAVGPHSHDHDRAVDSVLESSAEAAYAAIGRLLHPHPVTHLAAVAVAAAVGFVGNELVARYRIRTGRRIGSAALVADGLHARTDGFTSLAVLAGAGGVAIGWRWADPVVGLLITAAILMVGWQAAREVLRRLMDAVDPDLVDAART